MVDDNRRNDSYEPRGGSRYGNSSGGSTGGGYRRSYSGGSSGGFHRRRPRTRKYCKFCEQKVIYIDFKNLQLLRNFMNDRGKMFSGHSSGNCAKHQRSVATAIKRARAIALLPYVA